METWANNIYKGKPRNKQITDRKSRRQIKVTVWTK